MTKKLNIITALLFLCIQVSGAQNGDASKRLKTVHVFVALCDNVNQGIVPVPAKLGNGDDPDNNLYWGAMYGVKSFLKRSPNWKYIEAQPVDNRNIIERIVFKHRTANVYLVADGYRGSAIKWATTDFLWAAGSTRGTGLKVDDETIGLDGRADLVVYAGHNGLMDFKISNPGAFKQTGGKAAFVFACRSKPYFESRLAAVGCTPLLLTTGFMAPEAYTLDAAVCAWLSGGGKAAIKDGAATAYNKYQRCGIKGARRLFSTN